MANQKLKRLNYATIHDLRSPLNNIMSLVNLIDLRMINDVETKEIIELIKESSTGLKLSLDSSLESFKIRDMDQKKLEQVDFLEILQILWFYSCLALWFPPCFATSGFQRGF